MATPLTSHEEPARLLDDRRELAERVASSLTLLRSRRLRELLLFISDRALREPHREITEQELARVVFGRAETFDPTTDTLVRVQVSHLRKRLQQFFASEGADEPLLLELPKGSYMPRFRPRQVGTARAVLPATIEDRPTAAPAAPAVPAPAPFERRAHIERESPARATIRRPPIVLVGLALTLAASVVMSVALYRKTQALEQRLEPDGPRPAAHALWRQVFGDGRSTSLILADSGLSLYQDILQRQLSVAEYQNGQFTALARAELRMPEMQYLAYHIMNRQFTSIADGRLVQKLALLGTPHGTVEVVHARNASPQSFRSSRNAVISGPRRVNPWGELFEERLNFRSRFDESAKAASFMNVAPLPGEAASYAASWREHGYCRVAYLSNLDGTGSVLLLSGTDMPSTDAGVELVTSERSVRALRARLGLRSDREPIPHFEVLLRTRRLGESAPEFTVVAHRLLKP
jgi:hypothetical protein